MSMRQLTLKRLPLLSVGEDMGEGHSRVDSELKPICIQDCGLQHDDQDSI